MKNLKQLIKEPKTHFIMEAHDAMSAKIVEKIGFPAIWGSGLTMSAANGYRDLNEISYSEVVNIIDEITSNVNIPVLVDIDTGYGDFNNARLYSKKLEKMRAQGISIEDKLFPKSNSYLSRSTQELIEVDKFKGKIKAIKEGVDNPDFCVVARTEAFIAGKKVDDALFRANQYALAGADAIFIHSKKNTIEEIDEFVKLWDGIRPIIISPTTYDETEPDIYKELGISIVIWGNYMMRACIAAMKKIGESILKKESPKTIKKDIATLSELFSLQHMDEYYMLQQKY